MEGVFLGGYAPNSPTTPCQYQRADAYDTRITQQTGRGKTEHQSNPLFSQCSETEIGPAGEKRRDTTDETGTG